MPTVRANDIDLAYEEAGSGPVLLFIMGLTGTRHHWLDFHRRFADKHRVIAFDNRGSGGSGATEPPYTIAQMASDARALLDALGVESASVFGVSMGGMIAEELAILDPARIDRLILGCTHFGGARIAPPHETVIDAFARIGTRKASESVRALLEANFSQDFLDREAALVTGLVEHGLANKMPPAGFRGQFAAVATHDAESRLRAVRTPTLILHGDADRLIPVSNAKLLAEALPHAETRIFAGVGHMFWIEAPSETEAAIRAFLSGTPA
jgi:3-oxoadipate enol-lactonase